MNYEMQLVTSIRNLLTHYAWIFFKLQLKHRIT